MRTRESGELVRGRFKLDERLSRTMRGEVWFAHDLAAEVTPPPFSSAPTSPGSSDPGLLKKVVLRVFPGQPASAEEQMAALSSLKSPYLPSLLSWGSDEEDTFIVTARITGEDLAKYLARSGPIPPELLLTVIEHAALGLDALHALGFIHGDVKPQNIVLQDSVPPRAVVIDIEGAAVHGLGTPLYMAPERFGPMRPRDARSDLYSLGITAFELAVGKPPFYSDRAQELGALHAAAARPRLTDVDPSLPEELADLVARLIRIDPRERYQTARGLAADADSLRSALHKRMPWAGVRLADLPRSDTPLVGRETEWRVLAQAVQQALEKREQTVVLSGPAGIGKSRLLSRLRSLCEGRGMETRFLTCAGSETAGSLSVFRRLLAAWTERVDRGGPIERAHAIARVLDISRGVLYRLSGVFPGLANWVASAVGAARPRDDARDQSMFLEAVARLVLLAFGDHPAALILDGIDGADDATREVLRRIPRLAQGKPFLLVIAGRRVSWVDETSMRLLTLGPLDHGVAAEMVTACGSDFGAEAALEIAAASGGNPGLIEELVRLRRAGQPRVIGDRLETLVEARLQELPEATRNILGAAAEIGDGLDIARLAVATGRSEDEVGVEVRRGVAISVMRPGDEDSFVFPFAQIRAKLRASLGAGDRRQIHRRLLEWMKQNGRAELELRAIARSAIGAEDPQAIAEWLPRAAAEAAIAFDLATADELYAECAKHGVIDAVGAALARARVLVLAGRYAEGSAVLAEVEPRATIAQRAEILEQRAHIAFRANDVGGATEALENALEAAGERLHHRPGRILWAGAWRFFRALLRGGPRVRGHDQELMHRVRLYEELIPLYFWHQPSKMLPAHLRQLELAERLGTERERSSVYMHHAHVCQFARLSGRARRFVEEADRIRSSSPDPWDRAVARFERGTLAHRRGEWLTAQEDLRSSAQEIIALGDPYQAQIALGSLCLNCIQIGALDEYDWAANMAHDLAVASGDLRGEAWGLGWRSYGLILRARPKEALESLERAAELSRRVGDRTSELLIDRMRGEAKLAAAWFDTSLRVLETAAASIRRLSLRLDFLDGIEVILADALTHRHLAGFAGATKRELERAVKRAVRVGKRYPVWSSSARRVSARWLALQGNVPGAVRALEDLARDCDRAGERLGESMAFAEIDRLTTVWRKATEPKVLPSTTLRVIAERTPDPVSSVKKPTTTALMDDPPEMSRRR